MKLTVDFRSILRTRLVVEFPWPYALLLCKELISIKAMVLLSSIQLVSGVPQLSPALDLFLQYSSSRMTILHQ